MSEIRTIAEWAEHMGFSNTNYFNLKYRNYHGQNGKQAMVQLRLKKGKTLLLGNECLKQYEIAQEIGLQDEKALYKYFIRHCGESPGSIQRKGRVERESEKGE